MTTTGSFFFAESPPARRPWRSTIGAALLVIAVALLAIAAGVSVVRDRPAPSVVVPAAATWPVLVPSRPAGGMIAFAVPRGAAAAQLRGEAAYVMPDAMWLRAGDRVVVRNDDTSPHMIFYTLVMPGKTEVMTFDQPGIEVYSSGCAAHGGMLNAFTSVIITAS